MKNEKTVNYLKEFKVKLLADLLENDLQELLRRVELGEVSAKWALYEAAGKGMEIAQRISR
jgi:hypothetical protein